jgi:hypothetical protein
MTTTQIIGAGADCVGLWCAVNVAYCRGRIDVLDRNIKLWDWKADGTSGPRPEIERGWGFYGAVAMALLFGALMFVEGAHP